MLYFEKNKLNQITFWSVYDLLNSCNVTKKQLQIAITQIDEAINASDFNKPVILDFENNLFRVSGYSELSTLHNILHTYFDDFHTLKGGE